MAGGRTSDEGGRILMHLLILHRRAAAAPRAGTRARSVGIDISYRISYIVTSSGGRRGAPAYSAYMGVHRVGAVTTSGDRRCTGSDIMDHHQSIFFF